MRAVPSKVHFEQPFSCPPRILTRNYEYQFCSLSTLTGSEWKFIHKYMSFDMGGIQYWRVNRQNGIRMTLLYYRKHLIAWCAIDTTHSGALGARSKNPGITCWVLRSWRNKGIATKVIAAALCKYNIEPGSKVDVYSGKMKRICDRLGYKAKNIWID